jgi:two-component system, OmpR family, sensor histidine kinase BaeS
VNDLSELWRAEARQLPLRIDAVDVAAVARAVGDRFAPQAQARGITLELPAATAIALADHDRVAQILSNYLSNALRHAPDASRVSVATGEADGVVTLSVHDEGPGLAPDQLEAVFERFYRVDAARSRAEGGSGIGLAIVRALAEAMGGRAWAESDGPGLGATFRLALPTPRGRLTAS